MQYYSPFSQDCLAYIHSLLRCVEIKKCCVNPKLILRTTNQKKPILDRTKILDSRTTFK